MKETTTERDFSNSPTLCDFLDDRDYFFKGIRGPFGSGKTTGCCAALIETAQEQAPAEKDNIRYTRMGVIRNTTPMLKSTTIKTWQRLFPPDKCGPVIFGSPITHHLKVPRRGDRPGMDCEVMFLGLDRPADVTKALGLECTVIFLNEGSEISKAIVDILCGRVGRYPSEDLGAPTKWGLISDTNSPDEDNWWYKAAEVGDVGDSDFAEFPWHFYSQPPAVFHVPDNERRNFPREALIRSAGKYWVVNPLAENIDNLIAGYYKQQLSKKRLDWIKRYLCNEYVFLVAGLPVVPEYNDSVMCMPLEYDPNLPMSAGIDLGLTPAVTFGQTTARGQRRTLGEIVTDGQMSVDQMGNLIPQFMAQKWPGSKLTSLWMDPSGEIREQTYMFDSYNNLRDKGFPVMPAPSQDIDTRRDALALPMERFIEGQPGYVIDPSCVTLRKGLAGGWNYRKIQVAGEDKYAMTPDKNKYSHVCEAEGYRLLGEGEFRRLQKPVSHGKKALTKTFQAKTSFDVFRRAR